MKFTKLVKANKQIEASRVNDVILKCIQDIQTLIKDFKYLDDNMHKLDIYTLDDKLDKYQTGTEDIGYALTDTIDYIIDEKNLLKKIKSISKIIE